MPDRLSDTFSALADPTRRAILARLATGEATVGELAEPFAMSLPAVSKHLKVLERARLISRGRAAQWRGPRGFTTISCEMDVRVDGAYRACMRSLEGTRHCRRGTYREIVPPARLVFTYAWEDAAGDLGHETLVTVTFADAGRGKTRLTLHQALFETESARDAHQGGWKSCLERFADYLAGLSVSH